MNILQTIGHDLKSVVVHVGHAFTSIFKKEDIQNFGHAALPLLKTELGKLVIQEVTNAIPLAMPGTEKNEKVVHDVMARAGSIGVQAETSVIKLLVELAYQFVKGNLDAVLQQVR